MYVYDEILTRNAMLQGSASTASPAGSKAIPIALARVAVPCCLLCCGGGGWGEREKSGAGAVVPLNAGLGVRRSRVFWQQSAKQGAKAKPAVRLSVIPFNAATTNGPHTPRSPPAAQTAHSRARRHGPCANCK